MPDKAQLLEQVRSLIQKRTAKKNAWGTLAVVLFVFLLLAYSVRKDWKTILTYPWQLDWIHVAEMGLMHIIAMIAMYLAWHFTMLKLMKRDEWKASFRIFGLSMLARRIPLPIWYVGSRVYLYQEFSVPASVTLTATAFEIGLIGLSGILCYIILLPWYTYTQSFPWWILGLPAGLAILLLIIRPGLLVDIINFFLKILKRKSIEVEISRQDLLLWGGLYLATWFIDGLGLYFAVSAFLPAPPPAASVVGISTVTTLLAMATMLLPSGFGLKELAMGALFSSWIPLSAGVVLSFIYRFLQTLIEAIWVMFGQRISSSAHQEPINARNNP